MTRKEFYQNLFDKGVRDSFAAKQYEDKWVSSGRTFDDEAINETNPTEPTPKRPIGTTASFEPEAPSLKEAVFPRSVEAAGTGFKREATAGALDAASLPLRLITAMAKTGPGKTDDLNITPEQKKAFEDEFGTPWDNFKTELSKVKSTQGGIGGFVENVIRDPATAITLPLGGISAGIIKNAALKLGGKLLLGAGLGATEGVISSAIHQAENVSAGEKISPTEIATEVGVSAGLGAGGQLVSAAASGLNKLVGRLSEWTTGVDEKALRTATTKQGREVLKGAFDTQYEIGEKLVDMVNNAVDYMPDASKINNALEKMPAVNATPIIKKMETYIQSPITKEFKGVREQLVQKADELRVLVSQSGDSGYLPAKDMLNFRKELDYILSDQFGKESSSKFIEALKTTRFDIKEALVESAKGTEYAETMKELSKRLSSIDKMKKLLGRDVSTRELSGEKFINTLNNKGRKTAKKWLSEFEQVFGGDFVNESQLAKWADQFGDEGSGSWLPRWTTGRSLWAKGAGASIGSPKIATRVTLPTTQKLEQLSKKRIPLSTQAVRTGMFRNLPEDEE